MNELPRRITADEAQIGDLIERRLGESQVSGRFVRKDGDALHSYHVLLWHPTHEILGWELRLLKRHENTAEGFTEDPQKQTDNLPPWEKRCSACQENLHILATRCHTCWAWQGPWPND